MPDYDQSLLFGEVEKKNQRKNDWCKRAAQDSWSKVHEKYLLPEFQAARLHQFHISPGAHYLFLWLGRRTSP